MSVLRFAKGHGSGNDFVILPDVDDALAVDAALVSALCDRRFGIGADGLLRVVPSAAGGWFMDHRNADGSLAETCGNGIRVVARYLVACGLAAPGPLTLHTRSGPRAVEVGVDGDISVDMGEPECIDAAPLVAGLPGRALSMGNPHVVVALPDRAALAALDLSCPPQVTPPLLDGQNVEYICPDGPGHALRMRVHERGVGETPSCGSGICAAVVAAVLAEPTGRGEWWTVTVPGGRLQARWAQSVTLRGPAVIVAHGEVDPDALTRGSGRRK